MIYTVTVNPAVDYLVYVEDIKTGEINRSVKERLFCGGKGVNVSQVLNELGVDSVATGFIAGSTGNMVVSELTARGISADFVRLEKGFTRINVKIRSGAETDINGQGPDISACDIEKLLKKLENLNDGDILVLAGSVPRTLPRDIYKTVMERLDGRGVRVAVDATGDLLLDTLRYKPFLVKPNSDELGEMFGVKITSPKEIGMYAARLRDAGALNVLVSMGAEGAYLLDEFGKTHFMKAKPVKTVNTVGAGDSMVAGFIAGYIKTGDYDRALELGTAAGGATAACEGLARRDGILALTGK